MDANNRRYGQPVRVYIEWWGHLLVVACEPLAGFVHIVRNVEYCVREYGQYHISVAQYPVATWEDDNNQHGAWSGAIVQLPVDYVSAKGVWSWVIVCCHLIVVRFMTGQVHGTTTARCI